ncbi:MAG: cyclic nucleotide-binding domain-containing protein [Planctomycetes bacterium]|nr:cyclic nucleotide-binding domain-containing protein [Planctomycetota bacterium]
MEPSPTLDPAVIRDAKSRLLRSVRLLSRGELEAVGEAGEVLGHIREGDFFGEMAVLFDRPRSVTVRATRPRELLVLGGGGFRRNMPDFPDADTEFRRLAAERQAARRES